ncbi:MAG: Fis family transcriptional regulator [Deltaproteobacteria bacterium HGW-Deltaproteobacteria-14]|nr:MAG: Fis family transcriptional regulator [Deltaproteobacteria bacterium HGW-Deltaproteobacteria-14]
MSATILIVDDEKNIRVSLARSLSIEGYRCDDADSVASALARFEPLSHDLVMLDVQLPDGSGLDVLAELKGRAPETPVVVMSGHGTIEMAKEAIRLGAHDFIEKPLSIDKILITLHNALQFANQRRELETLRAKVRAGGELVGRSRAMSDVRERIELAAPSRGRVLITGESGTGKELIARAVHEHSDRADKPFVKLNCAAIPSELIESELFGHERGAFTGAHQARKGKFELAHGGTLFLDEIGDMRLDVQAKLLRALQEGEIERVGGARPIRVDVRVVAATNKDLEAAIEAGEFRDDLFYRLNVIPIQAPPLRSHKEDVPELVASFVTRVCEENGMKRKEVTSEALELIARHDWPGNVRELRNACERLVILTPAPVVDAAAVRRLLGEGKSVAGALYRAGASMRDLVADAERAIILAALSAHGGHVTQTAAALQLERSHLYKKMRALGIRD